MLKVQPLRVCACWFANNQKGKSLELGLLPLLHIPQSNGVLLIPYYSLVEDQGKYLV